jgi:hypothetical protein
MSVCLFSDSMSKFETNEKSYVKLLGAVTRFVTLNFPLLLIQIWQQWVSSRYSEGHGTHLEVETGIREWDARDVTTSSKRGIAPHLKSRTFPFAFFSNSLFTNDPTIGHYIIRAIDSVVK